MLQTGLPQLSGRVDVRLSKAVAYGRIKVAELSGVVSKEHTMTENPVSTENPYFAYVKNKR